MKLGPGNLLKNSPRCHSEAAPFAAEESAFSFGSEKQIPRTARHGFFRKLRTFYFCFVIALFVALAPATNSQVPSGRDVVKAEVYASLDPAGRGSSFQIAVVMNIRPGFHVNAREKSEEYLIATDLKAEIPSGFTSDDVVYPKGKLETFSFSKKPLNVYQGKVILRLPVNALASAPLGERHIPLKLRYQACSSELCLPPTTLPLDAVVNIAASASSAKPAHREIFSSH